MAATVATLLELDAKLTDGTTTLLNFWASWSEACTAMDAVVAQLTKDFPQLHVLRVEAEEAEDISERYSISAVPTFVLLQGSTITDRVEGADAAELSATVQKRLLGSSAAAAPAAVAAPAAPAASASALASGVQVAAAATQSAVSIAGRVEALVRSSDVMLFMKGSPEQPRCGFSGRVVRALQDNNVKFGSFDILQDQEVRAALKEYSNWPTYPQVFVKGELLGGCDIVEELQASGELGSSVQEMLQGAT